MTESRTQIKRCVITGFGLGALVGMQAQAQAIVYTIDQTITDPLNGRRRG
jgi:hypothetical protein